ncbi:hypothetical protein XENOCAPTIV_010275 [Xenoophorus captivus]|uniref:Uncharacterized protein n=1 Tax=Xenoophorus captivus TaxID=1517983 RepID=A0ABV0RHY4_9TELE
MVYWPNSLRVQLMVKKMEQTGTSVRAGEGRRRTYRTKDVGYGDARKEEKRKITEKVCGGSEGELGNVWKKKKLETGGDGGTRSAVVPPHPDDRRRSGAVGLLK